MFRAISLGELLVEERLIDEDGLRSARRDARRDQVALVVALTQEGRVTEEAIACLLERRLKLPRAVLAELFVELDALRSLSHDVAERYCLLPYGEERIAGRQVLRVAMADPLDREAIEEIEAAAGCRVEPVIALPSEIVPAIQKSYRGITTKVIHRTVAEAVESGGAPARGTVEARASCDQRLSALVQLLIERGLVSEADYVAALQRFLD